MAQPKKKLIEVALPLEAINRESAREKSIRQGHPSTLHVWWARRPLAACRAALFASLVDDPSSHPERFTTEEEQETERQRLFRIIEELVQWENSNNDRVLEQARVEIMNSTDGHPPSILDPFCGGGSIPLEAQRLGLEVHASDLNPVAVLITKALVEIPPKFAGMAPVNRESRRKLAHSGEWRGAEGLAEDIRYYGKWLRDEAERKIGHLYPKAKLPRELGGGEATVIAWLWARTVQCPNPACRGLMPLAQSFWLSKNPRSRAWVEPTVDGKRVRFDVRTGDGVPPDPPKVGRGARFRCLICGQEADEQHIKSEGLAGRMGMQLMAMATEGQRGRVYLSPTQEQTSVAEAAHPTWGPEEKLALDPRAIWCPLYGLTEFRHLFTPRQLLAVSTFSDLVAEAMGETHTDGIESGLRDSTTLSSGGAGATAYAEAMATYLSFVVSQVSDDLTSLVTWRSSHGTGATRSTFTRQGLPMVWDFAEANPFAGAAGDVGTASEAVARAVATTPARGTGVVKQLDARSSVNGVEDPMVCTDPPYYDNIGYADLADFFYVWLRHPLRGIYPDLLSTVLTPKDPELVAVPYRFAGNKKDAERFFENGLKSTFHRLRAAQRKDVPLTLFYAFKQAESDDKPGAIASTGWETMLNGLLEAQFEITATWPIRSERGSRAVALGTNALASSIVLACRPRSAAAPMATRKEFLSVLRLELPGAVKQLQRGNIAPVDLAQAAIGPGMAVFSHYSKVIEADGSLMPVREALGIINHILDETLSEQESEFDPDTRWALAWFESHGTKDGPYGEAEVLSKAKDTSVSALAQDGFLVAKAGKVRLLGWEELDERWDPSTDPRLSVWEVTHHLIRTHQHPETGSEHSAADLIRKVGHGYGEVARDLAYRLYTISERKGWAREALAYNALVVAWPEIARLAAAEDTGQARLEV